MIPTGETQSVHLGAAALTAHFDSRDWEQRVVLEALDVSSSESCVLGQLFGSFFDGLRALHLDALGSVRHGFEVPQWLWDSQVAVDEKRVQGAYEELRVAWVALLERVPVSHG